ncbi:glycoside hydrolase family 13 protein [Paenibacillus camerounensis]|uniref:glycoside hydrolase family 13 protein n=1 Tax=Paenibacillus camerounensis TaxID=1243663 RepID=UPI0005A90A2E|nr:glycoside hydrolase family 13 protein [Paenibacillus camerounensis]
MDLACFIHEPKSPLSYAFDAETLHIRVKTKKDDLKSVTVLAMDPFNWKPVSRDSHVYEFAVDMMQRVEMKKEYVTRYHDCWFAELTGFNWRRIKYGFVLDDGEATCFAGCQRVTPLVREWAPPKDYTNYYNYPYILEEDLYEAPEWVKETVWYQIFPDRFNRSSSSAPSDRILEWGSDQLDGNGKIFGGNLQGVTEKLDYIQGLGCTGIYFTPIFDSPSSHKYDTKDYFNIDPVFGDNEILGKLVEEAHKRGIRVMLDAVFNHCGYEHPFWQDVLKQGRNSPYYDYFYILDGDKEIIPDTELAAREGYYFGEHLNYRTFAYTEMMPKWNTGNPEAREYLISAAIYWTERYNIDGWRLDVANEVSHDFWRVFRTKLKSIRSDIYILGENWLYSNPWLQGDQFDAVMNYEFTWPVTRFFGTRMPQEEQYSAEDFRYAINQLLVSYPKHVALNMFNLLDSHDTARILHLCGDNPELVKLTYVFLLTYGGSPSIYYGGEVGVGGDEHHNRQCMPWNPEEQNQNLYETVRRLISLRREHPQFKEIDLEWLSAAGHEETLIYKKASAGKALYVLLHNAAVTEAVALPEQLRNRKLIDLYNNQELETGKEITLLPYSFLLLAES